MPKHFDVHLIHIVHVVVPDDTPEPEWGAVDIAAADANAALARLLAARETGDFWVSDKQDVYPVDPCDCQS